MSRAPASAVRAIVLELGSISGAATPLAKASPVRLRDNNMVPSILDISLNSSNELTRFYFLLRLRITSRAPANVVRAIIAELGSISGTEAGPSARANPARLSESNVIPKIFNIS
jgi:hypothetical protein